MSDIVPLTADELGILHKVDTPTVCNVIELFDIRPRNTGYMDRRIQSCFPEMPPMVGYASTATFRSNAPPRGTDVYSSLDDQLRQFANIPGPPVVVFQDLDDPAVSATFGEVMCATYKAFGAAGIITSGAGRDLDQVRALGFPAFTGGTICSHGYCHIIDLHVPVHVGGITIYPGDLLHADVNGVTTIPNEIASAVAKACLEFIKAEEEVLSYVKGPNPTIEGFSERRKRLTANVQALTKKYRVSGKS
ncbi:MAG: RraA family protein [Planctomycetota bacterium]